MGTRADLSARVAVASGLLAFSGFAGAAADPEEEARKQAARQISSAIAARIAATASRASEPTKAEQGQFDKSVWGTVQYMHMTDDDAAAGTGFDSDTVLGIVGLDKRFNDWYLGVSASYNDSDIDSEAAVGEIDSTGFSIGPYAAWLFHPNFFANASVRYEGSDADTTGAGDSDRDGYSTDVMLNGVWVRDEWTTKARAGWRYSDGSTDTDAFTTGGITTPAAEVDSDTSTLFAGGELGYRFTDRWRGFAGLQYEHSDTDIDPEPAVSVDSDESTLYGNVGVDVDLSQQATLTISSDIEFGNSDFDLYTVGGNLRIEF